jgi:NodT family efflux transporter outer membrane factor (OMF) lipoprotein
MLCGLLFLLTGCTKVGPDFTHPTASLSPHWLEGENEHLSYTTADGRVWWRVFGDALLDKVMDRAYRENLSVRIAGVRVLEARAQLNIVTSTLYLPQSQQISGYVQQSRLSDRSQASLQSGTLTSWEGAINAAANWEADFWGKFRRDIESAEAAYHASVADYDAALVSLTADTASAYVTIRTLEKRIEIARWNITTQQEALAIAQARLDAGTTTQLDVEQATTVLKDTQATLPVLESQLRQTKNALSILLGLPPSDLADLLAGSSAIPVPPPLVAVGIPAELLTRRPDIRSAMYRAAAQSAQIGVAKAELYPAFSLSGTFGFLSTDVSTFNLIDLFRWGSRYYTVGPGVQWPILDYWRITNNVRVQDARFQELLIGYQNSVLKAQQEVEDSLVAFVRSQEQGQFLADSASAAKRSLDIARAQYAEGARDFTAVLSAEQTLLREQDSLASTLGAVAGNLIGVYRALGGGWQIREGNDFIPPDVKEIMAKRTNWGDLLTPAAQLGPVSNNLEGERHRTSGR